MAMLWIISIITTVFPTPAPPNIPIFPPRGRDEEVDDLDPGFEDVDRGVLFKEGGRLAVDRNRCFASTGRGRRPAADDVEDAAPGIPDPRDADRSAQILRRIRGRGRR